MRRSPAPRTSLLALCFLAGACSAQLEQVPPTAARADSPASEQTFRSDACTLSTVDAAADPRLRDNPLLVAIRVNAPEELPGMLCQLDQITSTPPLSRAFVPSAANTQLTVEQLGQLRTNPAVSAAYLSSPDAMLELLRRMMRAAQGTGANQR